MSIVVSKNTGVMVHRDQPIVFWPVVKCGHTTLDVWMKSGGFKFQFDSPVESDPAYDHLVVIRDPFLRYISACAQVWREGIAGDLDWDLFVDAVDKMNVRKNGCYTAWGNHHFVPLTVRCANMPPEKRITFDLDDLRPLRAWLADRGVFVSEQVPHKNPTMQGMVDYAVSRFHRGPIERHYQHDFDLWRASRSN